MANRISKDEARLRIMAAIDAIYDALAEIRDALREAGAEGALDRARHYWMAHIDGALQNRGGWLGGSFITAEDTLKELEEDEEEEQ